MRLRIIDLDGAVTGQDFCREQVAAGFADVVQAGDLAPRLRIVAAKAAARELAKRLGAPPSGEAELFFYGSGDFHHLTGLFVERIEEPVTVIHFDNHPDWVTFPATSNCGGWVNRVLEQPHVRRVVTIGPASGDLALPELKAANLSALREGRIEMYPWRAAPTRLWGAPVDTAGASTRKGRLVWRNLADEAWEDFVEDLVDRLGPEPVWITLDKDVLSAQEAVTNWDQGDMRLDQVLFAVERLAERRRVLGGDICGDFSPPRFDDLFRRTLAWFDHPPQPRPNGRAALVNGAANARIAAGFAKVLS